jgi:hypothetical protein
MGIRKPEELVMTGMNASLGHWCIRMEKKMCGVVFCWDFGSWFE